MAQRPFFIKRWRKRWTTARSKKIPMLKSFTVFNVEQIDGLAIDAVPQPETEFDPLPKVEALFTRSGAKITECVVKAFYRPATDEICLPERYRFADAANFYATGLHELVHWTGAKSRLNREKGGWFSSEGIERASKILMPLLIASGQHCGFAPEAVKFPLVCSRQPVSNPDIMTFSALRLTPLAVSGKDMVLPSHPPLRTVCAGFPTHGSSLSKPV